jgi:hypothetical protein
MAHEGLVALTVDVYNGSQELVTVDVPGAVLAYESVGGSAKGVARAVAAGPGAVPVWADLTAAIPTPLTLAPQEGRTVWIAFSRFAWPGNARVTLNLKTTAGQSVAVTLRDPATGRSNWSFPPGTRWGVSGLFEGQLFGTQGYAATVGIGPWVARGPFRLNAHLSFGETFVAGAGALDDGATVALNASLAWTPLDALPGVYVTGTMKHLDFDARSTQRDRWFPAVSVGLENGWTKGPAPAMFFRLGYVHLFDDGLSRRDGFMAAFGTNSWLW